MTLLTSLIRSMTGSVVNMLVYALMIAVFILGLIKCVFPVVGTRGLLHAAITNIRAGADAKKSWQEDDFLGKGSLSAHWSEYLNNLFFADGVYHNASNVEDYINEETVIYGPGRSMFADAIPGMLVSIGFLGTLIGLAQGLAGFSIEDSEAVLGSITTLIPGMQTAFFTSIVGVVCSISFTLIIRAVNGSTERELRTFYGAMSRHAGVLSVDPMTQVAIYQQEQTALIRKMAKDIDGKLADNVAAAMEPLNNTLRNFVSVTTKDQMRFLDAVVSRFIDRMDDTMSGQIKRLSKALTEAAQYQEEALRNVRAGIGDSAEMLKSVREVTKLTDDMIRGNAAYIEALRQNQKKTDDMFAGVSGAVEQMELVSRQQANYLNTVSAMHAEILRSSDQMARAVQDLMRAFDENTGAATDEMRRTAQEMRDAGQDLQQVYRDCAGSITRELQTTLDDFTDYVNRFSGFVNDTVNSIGGSLNGLPRAVNDTANQFLDQMDRLTDAIARAQQAVDAAQRPYR